MDRQVRIVNTTDGREYAVTPEAFRTMYQDDGFLATVWDDDGTTFDMGTYAKTQRAEQKAAMNALDGKPVTKEDVQVASTAE